MPVALTTVLIRLLIILVLTMPVGCRTAEAPADVVAQRVRLVERFQLKVVFKDAGGIKRMAHNFSHLRLEVVREISVDPSAFIVSISCTPQELEGFIQKIKQSPDIISVVRYE